MFSCNVIFSPNFGRPSHTAAPMMMHPVSWILHPWLQFKRLTLIPWRDYSSIPPYSSRDYSLRVQPPLRRTRSAISAHPCHDAEGQMVPRAPRFMVQHTWTFGPWKRMFKLQRFFSPNFGRPSHTAAPMTLRVPRFMALRGKWYREAACLLLRTLHPLVPRMTHIVLVHIVLSFAPLGHLVKVLHVDLLVPLWQGGLHCTASQQALQ